MNDFISKQKQYEIINQVIEFLDSDNPINDISEFLEDEIRNINKNHKDIGLKDINGKSIYADSSIVEFSWIGKISGIFTHKHKGYFTWDEKNLQYKIKFISVDDYLAIRSDYHYMTAFKIIDTIQENKLGLIK